MAITYEILSNDEKAQIKIAAKRSLEYQIYTTEVDILLEQARTIPDSARIADLQALIKEKQDQIKVLA